MSTAGEHAKRIGAVLGGRYRLERVLGAGGMGAVYEAQDPTGQRYAIKMLFELTGAEEALRFSREARIMSALSHPNITRIVESGVDGATGSSYLVMELLSGQDIESLLERCGQLPPALAARVVTQACAGIAAAHAAGIIHRDVKPANLFLHHEPNGPVVLKVCDFGIAKPLFAGDTMTRSGDAFGSPSYMSPEQAKDAKRVDGRTDVWSLGMTLYHLLTGVAAFDHAKSLHEMLIMLSTRDSPPLQQLAPWVEPALAMVTHGALIRDVGQRCPTVEALANALRPLCGGSETLALGMFVTVPEALRRAARRAPVVVETGRDHRARHAPDVRRRGRRHAGRPEHRPVPDPRRPRAWRHGRGLRDEEPRRRLARHQGDPLRSRSAQGRCHHPFPAGGARGDVDHEPARRARGRRGYRSRAPAAVSRHGAARGPGSRCAHPRARRSRRRAHGARLRAGLSRARRCPPARHHPSRHQALEHLPPRAPFGRGHRQDL